MVVRSQKDIQKGRTPTTVIGSPLFCPSMIIKTQKNVTYAGMIQEVLSSNLGHEIRYTD